MKNIFTKGQNYTNSAKIKGCYEDTGRVHTCPKQKCRNHAHAHDAQLLSQKATYLRNNAFIRVVGLLPTSGSASKLIWHSNLDWIRLDGWSKTQKFPNYPLYTLQTSWTITQRNSIKRPWIHFIFQGIQSKVMLPLFSWGLYHCQEYICTIALGNPSHPLSGLAKSSFTIFHFYLL